MVQKLQGQLPVREWRAFQQKHRSARSKVELGITQCRTGVPKPRTGLVPVHGPLGAGHTARDIYSHSLLLALPPELLLLSAA